MSLSESFVRRPVMATAINLVLLIIGLVAFSQLEFRHAPSSVKGEVQIQTIFPGANSFAVEYQVTKPLEDALAGLDGVRKLTSTSQDGMSTIIVKFKTGVNPDKSLGQVRDRVLATMSALPDTVKRPEIIDVGEDNPTIAYLMFEDDTRNPAELTDYIRRVVEDRLRLVDGVATVGHLGNQIYMVSVTPDPALLVEHGISVKDVVDALHREKNFASGGEIEGVTGKETIVLSALAQKPEDFANVTVKRTPNGRITVGNIADVSMTKKHIFSWVRVDGYKRVALSISAKPEANPLVVAARVHQFVDDLKKTMPPSMRASVILDQTRAFEASFVEMRHTLWEAIFLVGIIVTLSLFSIRAAILPIITVPLCIVGTFALMWLLNFSVNPVTLLALVLAVGLVVDDAIVVVENVYRHMEEGLSALQAAIQGMKEISFAVIVMTITLAAVYLPLIFQSDDSAVIFREFAWTLAGSVLISGFVALTLTPALCGKFLKQPKPIVFWEKLAIKYRNTLSIALLHPRKICFLLVTIALLGGWGLQRLPSELIPTEDEGTLQGNISVDNPSTEAMRDGWFNSVEVALKTIPERERVLTGIYQDQWMWWYLTLKPSDERKRNSKAIIKDLIKNIVAEDKKIQGFSSVRSEQSWDKPRLQMVVDRALAAELGVGIDAIEQTLSIFLSGRKATDFNFQGFDYDVTVQAPLKYRSEFSHLNTYFVAGAEGQSVPLGSLVSIQEILEPAQIKHYDRMRGAAINVSLLPEMPLGKGMDILIPIVKKHLPSDARFKFAGKAEQYKESKNAMWVTFGLALAFIYLVLAALFESFIYPFIVLLTVPLSIAGAVWAINFMGGSNNAYTIIGLVTLIGLITKHGILIVDFSNRLRGEKLAIKEAVLKASELRLRPVLMTTFAMVSGAVPLLFSVGAGAIAREHIGWVIIGGMTLGTVFSLYVVPVVYTLVAKDKPV